MLTIQVVETTRRLEGMEQSEVPTRWTRCPNVDSLSAESSQNP